MVCIQDIPYIYHAISDKKKKKEEKQKILLCFILTQYITNK